MFLININCYLSYLKRPIRKITARRYSEFTVKQENSENGSVIMNKNVEKNTAIAATKPDFSPSEIKKNLSLEFQRILCDLKRPRTLELIE